jgi:hypothetical protein
MKERIRGLRLWYWSASEDCGDLEDEMISLKVALDEQRD